jgi:hypothetical protein
MAGDTRWQYEGKHCKGTAGALCSGIDHGRDRGAHQLLRLRAAKRPLMTSIEGHTMSTSANL